MDSQKLKVLLIVVFAAIAALYLGVAAATAQFEALAWVGGTLVLVTLLALGRHVWILLPASLGFAGTINALPGSPTPWALAGFAVGTILLSRILMRKGASEFTVRFTWLDFAVLLQGVAVAQAYIRNPSGLLIFGGDLVGGKQYIVFSLAIACYLILSIVSTQFKTLRWATFAFFFGGVVDGILQIVTQFIPSLSARILPFYSGIDATAAFTGATYEAEFNRLSGGKDLGPVLATAAFGFQRPLLALLPVKWIPFLLATSAIVLTLLSGFRSIMVYLVGLFIAGCLLRRKPFDLILVLLPAVLGLAIVLGTGLTSKLPHGAQRILTVIPFADIDPEIRRVAEGSKEGRVEMWKLALFTDRYIKNKWLGDGFAYSADEQRAKFEIAFGGTKTFSKGMDFIQSSLASGSYHGFHVETIRFTGVLGLAFAVFLMFVCLRTAWILASHFRGRPEFGVAAYLAIPFLVYPFQVLLIFGAYRAQFPQFIVMAGMLKILDNIRVAELRERLAHAPATTDQARQPQPERKRMVPNSH